jgi:hypothetical protein
VPFRIFTCTDHEGHWPVGVASVVVADNETSARAVLGVELYKHGLTRNEPFTLQEVDLSHPHAVVLMDGDY